VAPEPKRDSPGPDSITRNTGFGLAVKLLGAAFTGVLTLYLVRALGPKDYGVFALAVSVGGLVLIPSDLGISQAAARFIAEQRHVPRAVAAVIADALRLKLLVSGLVAVALIALAEPIASAYGTSALTWPLRLVAIAVFGQSLMLMYGGALEALGKVSGYLRIVFAESALETVASIAFVLLGAGATGAALGRAAAYAAAAGFGLVLLMRTVRHRVRLRERRDERHTRRILAYGSALVLVDGAFTLFSRIDSLLIGAIVSVQAVALFEAPMRFVSFLGYPGAAAASGVAPRVVDGSEKPRSDALERALRYLILVQGVVIAPMIVWAEPLVRLGLGDGYGGSAGVLRAAAPYAFLLGLSPVLAGSVNYLGEARRRVPIAIATLLVNLVIDLIFLPRIGIVAGAIGTDVAYALYVWAHFAICRRVIDLPLRRLVVAFTWTMLAAAAMAAVLLAFGVSDVPIPLLPVGALLGTFAYGAVLFAGRELTTAELGSASRSVRAAFAR
jgi:O-antigen/teichoic acid export membrane protein